MTVALALLAADPAFSADVDASLLVPSDRSALAARLVEVERAIRDPAASDVDRLGHVQQRIYRVLADDPATGDAVVAALPADLAGPVGHGVAAVRGHASITQARGDLPAWTIATPPPVEDLLSWYREGEAKYGVPWSLLAAVNLVETRFGRIRATSVSGAQGPMQFMPATWAAYGAGDVNDPRDAILGAAHLLAATGARTNPDKAIWAYNHHTGYVTAVRELARVMADEPATLRAFHGWEAYYHTTSGWIWLPLGYSAAERGPIAPFCAQWGAPYCPG